MREEEEIFLIIYIFLVQFLEEKKNCSANRGLEGKRRKLF
jgi:hypothetical protein